MLAPSLLTATVGIAAFEDARTGYIPDRCSIGGTIVLLIIAACSGTFTEAGIGMLVCAAAMGSLYVLTLGRGLGFGDVKLAAAIGAGLGMRVGLAALGLAFVFGAIVAVGMLALGRMKRGDAVYFAPYLAAGTLAAACAHAYGVV